MRASPPRAATVGMWADAVACLAIPRLARWTVVVVDRDDGSVYPVTSVRLRLRRSAETWIRHASWRWPPPPGWGPATYQVRPLTTE